MTPVATDDTDFALRHAWMQAERKFASLPVQSSEVDGDKVLYSYWTPSVEERQQILQGAAVRLCCIAEEQPPVAIDVVFVRSI